MGLCYCYLHRYTQLFMGCRDPNSGPHACLASILIQRAIIPAPTFNTSMLLNWDGSLSHCQAHQSWNVTIPCKLFIFYGYCDSWHKPYLKATQMVTYLTVQSSRNLELSYWAKWRHWPGWVPLWWFRGWICFLSSSESESYLFVCLIFLAPLRLHSHKQKVKFHTDLSDPVVYSLVCI